MNFAHCRTVAAVAAFVLTAGCAGSGSAESEDWLVRIVSGAAEPVTLDEARYAAWALKENTDDGPASFVASVDSVVVLEGVVDWKNVTGSAVSFGQVVVWDSSGAVFLGSDGGVTFADPSSTTSAIISELAAFGARTPDNPVLVAQNGTTVVDRSDDALTFLIEGKREAAIEVELSTGHMSRAALRIASPSAADGTVLVEFEFADHGEVSVEIPLELEAGAGVGS